MKETLSSISKRLNISSTTISRVLTGQAAKYRISEETARLIMDEVKNCGYNPNTVAQSLRNEKANYIGLIIPRVSNPFFADLADSIISEAYSRGHMTIIMDSSDNDNNQRTALSTMVSRAVDGIIIAPCGNDYTLLNRINESGIPIVLVDRYFPECNMSFVTSNNFDGVFKLTNHLIEKGHRNIACIQGDLESYPNKRRIEGYMHALAEHGLQDKAIVVGDGFSVQNGYLETKLLLQKPDRPTALIALSYTILLGVIKAIKESHLRIPEDISVVSFDETLELDYFTPSITHVRQLVEDMGMLSIKLLFDKIRNNSNSSCHIELTTKLVIGDSVKQLR